MPPPGEARLPGGEDIDLVALAQEICRRYREQYPDEEERYGDAGVAWCVHDNQHLLNWAAVSIDLEDPAYLERQVTWLAEVLEAREFPLERLARDLEIAARVVAERELEVMEAPLTEAAALVRSKPSFL
jgi:hypothetical protein